MNHLQFNHQLVDLMHHHPALLSAVMRDLEEVVDTKHHTVHKVDLNLLVV
jgi:hypothetical protein